MRKLILLPFVCLVLVGAGCSGTPQEEQNDLNIVEYKKCIDAGMVAYNTDDGRGIRCAPPQQENSMDAVTTDACIKNGGAPYRSNWDNE